MKDIMEYKRFSVDLDFRGFIENLINSLSAETDHEKQIDILLDAVVDFYKADRAYVIEGDFEPVCAINTHERVADGKPYQRDTLKDLPISAYVRWGELFLKQEIIIIKDMEEIKDTLPDEYAYFSASDVKSLIVVPFSRKVARGFVGIDNPHRYKDDPLALRILTHIIVEEVVEIKLTDANAALRNVSAYPEYSVQVKLLGDFEITARGGILPHTKLTAQGKSILAIMLLNPREQFSVQDIYEVTNSSDKESGNEATAVSNAVYKVRNTLDLIGLKNLIIPDHGVYYLNPEYTLDTDVAKFVQFCKAMQSADNDDEKLEIGKKALGLYQSPLPPSIYNSPRCDMEAMDLDMKFLSASKKCAQILIQRRKYEEAYHIVTHALKIIPDDGTMILMMVRIRKAANTPGMKAYIRRVRKYLNPEEQAELEDILHGK